MTKADIFALALTVVSASGAEPLPTNGEQWHTIRQGILPHIPQVLSQEFLSLLKVNNSLINSYFQKLLSNLNVRLYVNFFLICCFTQIFLFYFAAYDSS